MSASWKSRAMSALSRYYAAAQVVEDARDELASLGLSNASGLDLDNRDAKQCACGAWVPFFTWTHPTAVTCQQCEAKQRAEVEADAREEKGLPRAAPVVATTTEEIAF